MRWWARHSLQTQPCTYAALVPWQRSSRRLAVTAASSALDHSSSVLPAGSCQSHLKRRRPRFVGLGEAPHLVRCQAKIAEGLPEWFAVVDRVEEPLTCRDGEPCLRFAPSASLGRVVLRLPAPVAVAALSPPDPSVHLINVPWAVWGPRRRPLWSRTSCSCSRVHGGSGSSPSESQRRTTGGVTLHAAAAWRTDVISSSLTARTLAINATTACNRDRLTILL